uniref:Programmed cell death 4 n=1 Tax=Pipistrellus kuhlii TaxID=59472 RepID=A0A7J7VC48_PIPKU|nr:programmed cell death 4 [Pipistrellus kuhlii]
MDVENEQILNVNSTDPGNLSDSLFSGDEENAGTEDVKNEINGNWISATSINEAKINAKAKRRLRKNSSRDSGRGDSVSDNGSEAIRSGVTVPTSPKGRLLDRRSRSGKGRGLPKKGWYIPHPKTQVEKNTARFLYYHFLVLEMREI